MKKWLTYPISLFCVLTILILIGCAGPFQKVNMDPQTGRFPTSMKVDKEAVRHFALLPGIENTRFLFLQSSTSMDKQAFDSFLQDSLNQIGFKRFLNKTDLAQFVIKSGMSDQIPTISDLVSLYKLNKVIGPFLIGYANLYRVDDCRFKFEFSLVEPVTSQKVLDICRTRTCLLDFDTEVCYPVLNVIKTWYDESSKLKKSEEAKEEQQEL